MRAAVLIMSAVLAGSAFAAEPTVDQVYRAASSGHYAQADQMMDQVLKAHPGSAKAHFVEAELKAKEGDLATARQELATARRMDPALTFAKPAAVNALMQRLGSTTSYPTPPRAESGFPWLAVMLGLGLLAVAMALFRTRSRPQVISAGRGYGNAPMDGYGYPPPSGPVGGMAGMGGGGLGSSILGGLATGAAVGAGVVAGEKLMHGLLDDEPRSLSPERSPIQPDSYDMGGNDFGLSDDASWDDNSSGGGW